MKCNGNLAFPFHCTVDSVNLSEEIRRRPNMLSVSSEPLRFWRLLILLSGEKLGIFLKEPITAFTQILHCQSFVKVCRIFHYPLQLRN